MTHPGRPLVIGHRGASGYRPEHTTAAYELAFELGADAVEPDIVATRDAVLVLRHENEISGTTDVADHPEFASRRTTKVIDGAKHTGWFTEDFTWAELATLTARERLPEVRPDSAQFAEETAPGILRLRDLIDLMPAGKIMVAEIKHATYFASIGLPLDELFANEIAAWATSDNLIVECFETTVLQQIRERGVPGRLVFLLESSGAPADQVAQFGRAAKRYADYLTEDALAELAASVDGISVDKRMLLDEKSGGTTDLVARAHAAGLEVYTWTLRAENRFLAPRSRTGEPEEFGDWQAEFGLILGTGLDGVFADQPDLVRALQG